MRYSIKTANKEIKNALKQYYQKDDNGKYILGPWNMLPIYLIGPAGIGKTKTVMDIAQELGLGFVSYSLVHHTRQTLMGLPIITTFPFDGKEYTDTEYTLSEVLGAVYKQVEQGHREGILLLDEANCCMETIQPILLSFLQTKVLGNSKLPEGWVILLCGNPPRSIYNQNARAWDGALMDRLRVMEIETNHEEFMEYISAKELHPVVRYYLMMKTEDAYICSKSDKEINLVTYRTWENLSDSIYDYERLGLEVTKAFINQFIKVDRVVNAFYELYGCSNLNDLDYAELTNSLLNHKDNYDLMKNLKDKPVSVIYGISNLCFRKLDERADELYNLHSSLLVVKDKILRENYNLEELLSDETVPAELKYELRDIWSQVTFSNMKQECIKTHNKVMESCQRSIAKLVDMAECFVSNIDKLDNFMLMTFYISSIQRNKAWIYVMSKADHPVLDSIEERLEQEKKAS